MKWNTVLDKWETGHIPTFPTNSVGFLWKTSAITKSEKSTFKQEIIETTLLPTKQNISAFRKHIAASKNKNVTSFPNLSGDTILVIPMPRKGKNFAHLKLFMETASKLQKKALFKEVTRVARKLLCTHRKIYISTHGFGIDYMHVRIGPIPKY